MNKKDLIPLLDKFLAISSNFIIDKEFDARLKKYSSLLNEYIN